MSETSFMVYVVGAIALHIAPLIALPEPEAAPTFDDHDYVGRPTFCCAPPREDEPLDPMEREVPAHPQLAREQAIEAARFVSLLGTTGRPHEPFAERQLVFDNEIYLHVESACCFTDDKRWGVKQAPLLPATRTLSVPTRVAIHRPTVAGELDARTVRRGLERKRRELAQCGRADTQLAAAVQFLIRDDGTVELVGRVPGARCIERIVETIAFPARGAPTQVHAPITLTSESLVYGVIASG